MDSEILPDWSRLTPELIEEIAARLHPNAVASSFKPLSKETSAILRKSDSTYDLVERRWATSLPA
ncbi:hypothetical protein CHLRE_05g234646v5 [Chlamydomonas reinhardtii]|uniref:Uncharacterized protein n=1 Tax=Chlamydomonas reinhardtii TaxID=3055 RepID=A0A2K3DSM0_CHLRE|nr:uncharacterized protein CHLRE_05g234646v5 [Chlamydomonas reinhardtii]PNW83534.1 hypothetical protein CHLRE_05g234646v5 [Chlamydomonas reinhardtii]